MARRNLLQQLSVCLWMNNARIIYGLCKVVMMTFPFPHSCTFFIVVIVCFVHSNCSICCHVFFLLKKTLAQKLMPRYGFIA